MANETALQEAQRRFNEVSERVRTDGDNWSEFLTCAARNHKYDFRDQLLIYDQRPNATACADIDLWNKRFSRWVNKGTKSVRLLSPDGQSVRHVFDITDTSVMNSMSLLISGKLNLKICRTYQRG